MRTPVTIDASVFVNALSPDEDNSDISEGFISQLRHEGVALLQPTLFITEIAGLIARKQDSTDIALEVLQDLKKFPNLTLIDLDNVRVKLPQITACAAAMRSMPPWRYGLEQN